MRAGRRRLRPSTCRWLGPRTAACTPQRNSRPRFPKRCTATRVTDQVADDSDDGFARHEPLRKAAVPTHLGCHRPAVVDTARQTFAANCNRAGRRRSSAPAASTPDQPKERRGKESAQRNPTGRVQCPSHRENPEDHYSETPKPRDEQSPQQRPHETALSTYVRDVTVGLSTDNNDFVRQATACHRTPLVGALACRATCDCRTTPPTRSSRSRRHHRRPSCGRRPNGRTGRDRRITYSDRHGCRGDVELAEFTGTSGHRPGTCRRRGTA